ncbi:MAG: hypothetical protein A3F67_08430 [Verrucomicrobia bacterium RIFCSPHIGHO2_12_FULL_41_10]|nr:MAG: hypothetical protein A3F67_08430 [Verrucomicrobia bacterium RIFCSPHIGHO2_12_FULL_41_10]HLB33152.1 hypothetical protein [Chthoniobacterales bacterium]
MGITLAEGINPSSSVATGDLLQYTWLQNLIHLNGGTRVIDFFRNSLMLMKGKESRSAELECTEVLEALTTGAT